MKEFVSWLLSENNSKLQIGLFDVWHFMYLFVILGGSILIAVLLHNKSHKAKEKALKIFAGLTIGFYIADFFLMPLSDSYNGIGIDKLPFHVCTFVGVLVPFAQFGKKLDYFKTAVVSLAVASSLMWMCYPGTALGGQPPFSYKIFQTFMYHGFLYGWGFLNLAFGVVKLDFRKFWKELAIILVILVWATLGNALYENQNWFFVKTSIFPFISDEVMPFVVVFCVYGTCFVVYCAYFAVCAIGKKRAKKHSVEEVHAA